MKIGAGVIGLGVGEQHARAYVHATGVELRWLHDRDPQRATDLAKALGVGSVAASFDDILKDDATNVVSIATYDDAHADQVCAALRAHKNVFCEKPLVTNEKQLALVQAAVAESKGALACNLVLRAAPAFVRLREMIASGELGEIYAFDGDYLYGRLHKILDGWRGKSDDYSVMMGGGVHLVDLMLWLTGQYPDRVSAVGSRLATRETSYRYDDYASATFQFPSGMVGRITANFACVHHHQHVVRVYGTKKTFLLDDKGPRMFHARGDDQVATPISESPLPSSKGDLIPRFLETLSRPEGQREGTRHELGLVAACLAADRARASGQTVRMEPS